MAKERYCSYEVSKLLEEKGFDEECYTFYEYDSKEFYREEIPCCNSCSDDYAAPTHQMAIDWLRQKHGILISIIPQEVAIGVSILCYGIYRIIDNSYHPVHNGQAATSNDYKDVIEEALKYCLTELI